MRVRILTASLAVVIGCAALGCKSAPKMAWWSSSKDSSKVESTAVAHAAPQLPSEIAKQADGMNSANPVQISTAPAFTPNATSAAPPYIASAGTYPSTGAQSYVPTTTSPAASTATTMTASSSGLPYNPNAVPAAKSAPSDQSLAVSSATPSSNAPLADRYGNSYSQSSEPIAPTTAGAAPNFSAPTNTMATASTITASNSLGDRYSMSSTPTSASPVMSPASEPQQVQTASAIASAEPYRPGGTGTYPAIAATNARYEVATRPATPTSSDSSVPNVAYPSSGTNQYR